MAAGIPETKSDWQSTALRLALELEAEQAKSKRAGQAEDALAKIKEHIDSGNSYEDCVNYAWHTIKAYEGGRDGK